MNTQTQKILTGIITIILAGAIIGVIYLVAVQNQKPAVPSKLDGFAQCLKDKGLTFYGAFWCPHCKAQKELFGSSVKYLPYKECSTPDGSAQTAVCIEKGIQSYPTWVFPDGSRLTGDVSPESLASKASCPLPK